MPNVKVQMEKLEVMCVAEWQGLMVEGRSWGGKGKCQMLKFNFGGLIRGFWKGLPASAREAPPFGRGASHFEKIAGFIFRHFAGLSFSFKSHSGMAHFDSISFFDPFFRYLSPVYSRTIG